MGVQSIRLIFSFIFFSLLHFLILSSHFLHVIIMIQHIQIRLFVHVQINLSSHFKQLQPHLKYAAFGILFYIVSSILFLK